jgi:uncharacterized protein YjbI with pentapeptide repeats
MTSTLKTKVQKILSGIDLKEPTLTGQILTGQNLTGYYINELNLFLETLSGYYINELYLFLGNITLTPTEQSYLIIWQDSTTQEKITYIKELISELISTIEANLYLYGLSKGLSKVSTEIKDQLNTIKTNIKSEIANKKTMIQSEISALIIDLEQKMSSNLQKDLYNKLIIKLKYIGNQIYLSYLILEYGIYGK